MTARAEHVVLIDIDALNLSYLDSTDTPNIDALADEGCFAVARGIFKSFSNPARSSIITGAWPHTHRNQAYYYDRDRDVVVGQERPYEDPDAMPLAVETIAQALVSQGRATAGIDYRNLEGYGLEPGDPTRLYATPGGDCTNRINAAIELLNGQPVDSRGTAVRVPHPPDLLAIYLDDVDNLGHVEGPHGPGMSSVITKIDHEIGRLRQAVRDVGIADRTVVVVTSDHGMVGFNTPILPDFLHEMTTTGLRWEVVPVGKRPAPESEIVIVATSRNADLTLRGSAGSSEGRRRVVDAARRLGSRVVIHDSMDLSRMAAFDRVGDLVVEAVSPYHLGANTDRPPGGGHGGSAEMNVPLFVAGPAIRPGAIPDEPRLVDIAPTITALLGARPPAHCEGRVLTELFMQGPTATSELDLKGR